MSQARARHNALCPFSASLSSPLQQRPAAWYTRGKTEHVRNLQPKTSQRRPSGSYRDHFVPSFPLSRNISRQFSTSIDFNSWRDTRSLAIPQFYFEISCSDDRWLKFLITQHVLYNSCFVAFRNLEMLLNIFFLSFNSFFL